MYQYGAAFLVENVRLAWELRGTSLAFPEDRIRLLTDFLLKGWQWMTRGINTVPGTMDRSASRKDALHSPDIRAQLPFLRDLVPEKKAELALLTEYQNGKGALNGFRYFPYSDFTSYQQPGFSFFVKTISERTLSTESINNENLKGHLLNSGDSYFIQNGQEYFNLPPLWNWEQLPGITGFKGAEKIRRKSFVGSVSDGIQGLSTMDYELVSKDGTNSIAAKKTWFCYQNKVVCLVANLKGEKTDSAYTVLDQCRWTGGVTTDTYKHLLPEGDHLLTAMNWVYHNKLAYIPLNSTAAVIQLHTVEGKWTTINSSETGEVLKEKIFMPVLLHTGLSAGQSFAYMIAYCSKPAAAAKYSKDPGLHIIQNDSLCQAVSFPDGTFMAAFMKPGSVNFNYGNLAVDKPCLVLIRKHKLFVSDPQHLADSLSVKINDQSFQVQMPGNGFTSESIVLKNY